MEDYLRADSAAIAVDSRDIVTAYVLANPGLTLEDLFRETAGRVSPDDIFCMIATNVVYADLHAAPLAEPSRVTLFVAQEMVPTAGGDEVRQPQTSSITAFHCGSTVTWDSRVWKVVNIGESSVGLLSEDQQLTELPRSVIETLTCKNRMQVTSLASGHGSNSAACERLSPGARERLTCG